MRLTPSMRLGHGSFPRVVQDCSQESANTILTGQATPYAFSCWAIGNISPAGASSDIWVSEWDRSCAPRGRARKRHARSEHAWRIRRALPTVRLIPPLPRCMRAVIGREVWCSIPRLRHCGQCRCSTQHSHGRLRRADSQREAQRRRKGASLFGVRWSASLGAN